MDDSFRRPFTSLKLSTSFSSAFRDKVLDSDLGWAKEDLDVALKLLEQNCENLLQWLDTLQLGFGLTVEIAGRAPVIPVTQVQAWTTLIDWMDPDVLVCRELARRGEHERCHAFNEWGPITRLFDREVDAVLKDGVSDLHVHMGGLRTANLLWLRVISGRTELARVPYYAPEEVDKRARGAPDDINVIAERDRIAELVAHLTNASNALGVLWEEAGYERRATRASYPDYFDESALALAMRERAMLARGFFKLERLTEHLSRERKRLEREGGSQPDSPPANPLEDWLDRYIFAKSKFIRRHRQPAESNPGLENFRGYFRRTDLWGGKRSASPRDQASPDVIARLIFDDLGAYLAQSQDLKRVELRIGPYASPWDYSQTFEAWSRIEEKYDLARRMEVRFAVHLKRSTDAREAGAAGETPAYRFLREVDRETAVLNKFRTDPAWEKHAWRISRIDLAGRERDGMPDLAAFCMNLVRGNHTAWEDLKQAQQNNEVDETAHRFWLRELELAGRDDGVRARLDVAQLGVTCHAGEDFAQPIEGLYSIECAAELLKLREGDTIGHGLAAGTDAKLFHETMASRRLTQRGAQFDAFLWAFFKFRALGAGGDLLQRLAAWLREEMSDIYPGSISFVPTVASLHRLMHERGKPVPVKEGEKLVEPSARLRHWEIWNADVARERAKHVPLSGFAAELLPHMPDLQKAVLNYLSKKGVILEFNPSSNLRISAAREPAAAPFVRIIKMQGDQLYATINTDNPGTFGTRIENEYALLFDMLSRTEMPRAEVVATLERMRRQGLRNVYWPDNGPR